MTRAVCVGATLTKLKKVLGKAWVFLFCFICLNLARLEFLNIMFPDVVVGKQHVEALQFNSHQRMLIVNCVSGLGNRMRAYAQGAALANERNMKLLIVWVPDAHLNATMDDLFDTTSLSVLNFDPKPSLSREATLFYDDEKDQHSNRILDISSSKDIYVRTPFRFASETHIGKDAFKEQLDKLKPCIEVRRLVKMYLSRLPEGAHEMVGVHIRHSTNYAEDVPKTLSPVHVSGAEIIAKHRNTCTKDSFSTAISRLLERNPEAHFLVAGDTPKIVQQLAHRFDSRKMHELDHSLSVYCRTAETRQVGCVRFAYVELLALSWCGRGVIFSHWSSFSEIITTHFKENKIWNGCGEY